MNELDRRETNVGEKFSSCFSKLEVNYKSNYVRSRLLPANFTEFDTLTLPSNIGQNVPMHVSLEIIFSIFISSMNDLHDYLILSVQSQFCQIIGPSVIITVVRYHHLLTFKRTLLMHKVLTFSASFLDPAVYSHTVGY